METPIQPLNPIPYFDPKIFVRRHESALLQAFKQVLHHGAYINGPEIQKLEEDLARFVGVSQAVLVGSGTDGLLMALMALNVGPGDEVIVPSFSFIATAEVVSLLGARPVFADVDPETSLMDLDKLDRLLTPRTRAVVVVSLYGHMGDWGQLACWCHDRGIRLIEDGAQSFGSSWHGRRSGSFPDLGVTSFFPAKPLGTFGDGGAIFTSDASLAQKLRMIREHGSLRRYYHTELGLNARFDTLQAALLQVKFDQYENELSSRRAIANRYLRAWGPFEKKNRFRIIKAPQGCESAWAQFTLWVQDRETFASFLNTKGIPTSIHYPRAMPDQPWYQRYQILPWDDWPGARELARHVISVPLYGDMPAEHQDRVIQSVIEFLENPLGV